MKNKTNWNLIVCWILIFMLGISTIYFVLKSDNYKNQTYKICRQFNFMAYLNAENIRHYQNSSFEYTFLPDCQFYKGDYSHKGKLTYEQFLNQNNLTHINWINNTN